MPPPHPAGTVAVDVSVNGQQYTHSSITFEFQDVIVGTSLSPRTGPVYGGTTVVIHNAGAQFHTTETRCRFGNQTVIAFNVIDDSLSCQTPVMALPQVVDVEVTDNDRQDFSFTRLQFMYEAVKVVSRLIPNRGPSTGDTVVRVQGAVFNNYTDGIHCKFGDAIVPAVWYSAEEVLCTSPALDSSFNHVVSNYVPVEVTFNDQDYTSSGVLFEYHPQLLVYGVYPHHGPAAGGTRVLIFGQNFANTGELYCLFGSDHSHQAVPVLEFVNSTHIWCITPPSLRTDFAVNVTVTNNGLSPSTAFSVASFNLISGNVRYTYELPVRVDDFYPPLGKASGNVSIRVLGQNFLPTLELKCRFADIVVQGRWIDDGSILCISPAYLPGSYPLEVSNNAQDFTNFGYVDCAW